jgi:hypothetical protein
LAAQGVRKPLFCNGFGFGIDLGSACGYSAVTVWRMVRGRLKIYG